MYDDNNDNDNSNNDNDNDSDIDDDNNNNSDNNNNNNMALMNQTMFLKFILFNQDMFRMKHHPSSVVQNKMNLCNK